jgi:hypothetical protein
MALPTFLGTGAQRSGTMWLHELLVSHPGVHMRGHHVPYQEHEDGLPQSLCVHAFFVIRDPRDVIVSLVHHVRKIRSNYLHWDYARLPSDKARLMAAIRGLANHDGSPKSQGIVEKLEVTLGWTEAKAVLTLRFEDLISERGGGSAENQSAAIRRIGSHLGWDIDKAEALLIGNEAFGKGRTFRRGMIGGWREVFDDELKETFKRAAGEYLIRLEYEKDCDW